MVLNFYPYGNIPQLSYLNIFFMEKIIQSLLMMRSHSVKAFTFIVVSIKSL
ncbi:hypothetical protein MOUN0_M00188 [Monosporozyma unispora]